MPAQSSTPAGDSALGHGAAASVLGYLHQAQWALLELLRKRGSNPDASLSMEMHDDVAWDVAGSPTEMNQLKLHTSRVGSLGNSSTDLWRTVGVWLDNGRPRDPYGPALTLVTNAVASDGSIAALLRSGPAGRDEGKALRLLEEAAERSTAKETKKAREAFSKLDPSERATFVSRMYVADGSLDFAGVEAAIEDALAPGAPVEHFQLYMDQVWGWWSRVTRTMLRDGLAMSVGQLLAGLENVRNQFTTDNLPGLVPTAEVDVAALIDLHAGRVYIRQLGLVGVKGRPVEKAILDYQRAYLQETRWLDNDLLDHDELEQFGERLVDEWERAYDFMCGELPDDADDDAKQRAGRKLLQELSDSALTIRTHFTDPFLARGKRHALADEETIGWHPDFIRRLASLLLPENQTA